MNGTKNVLYLIKEENFEREKIELINTYSKVCLAKDIYEIKVKDSQMIVGFIFCFENKVSSTQMNNTLEKEYEKIYDKKSHFYFFNINEDKEGIRRILRQQKEKKFPRTGIVFNLIKDSTQENNLKEVIQELKPEMEFSPVPIQADAERIRNLCKFLLKF